MLITCPNHTHSNTSKIDSWHFLKLTWFHPWISRHFQLTLNWSRMWRSTAKDMPRSSWIGTGGHRNWGFHRQWGAQQGWWLTMINHDQLTMINNLINRLTMIKPTNINKPGTGENMWGPMVAFLWAIGGFCPSYSHAVPMQQQLQLTQITHQELPGSLQPPFSQRNVFDLAPSLYNT